MIKARRLGDVDYVAELGTRSVFLTLKKPGKPDYSNVKIFFYFFLFILACAPLGAWRCNVKVYRVICLLNYLGKVLEKVVATMISKTYEEQQLLHNGRIGYRVRRSATDAVAILIQDGREM